MFRLKGTAQVLLKEESESVEGPTWKLSPGLEPIVFPLECTWHFWPVSELLPADIQTNCNRLKQFLLDTYEASNFFTLFVGFLTGFI